MRDLESDLGTVVSRVQRQYPDHRYDCAYGVCLPVYQVVLKVVEMAESDLSTTARFMLQLAHSGIAESEEIGRLMGLDAADVVGTAVELLGTSLIVQRPDGGVEVTEEGRRVLREGGRLLHPSNRHTRVPYDPITRRIPLVELERLREREYVRKKGLFVAPVGPRKPRLSSIALEEVIEYERVFGRRGRRGRGEVLEVSGIKDVTLKYREDVVLAKLDAAASGRPVFAAYRAGQYLKEESAAMQRLSERGVDLVPEDCRRGPVMPWAHSAVVTREESNLLETIEALGDGIREKEREARTAQAQRGATLDARERAELAVRVQRLEEEKNALKVKLGKTEAALERKTKGKVKLLRTEEHRRVLLEGIDLAMQELTLVSAWVGDAFDAEVQGKLVEAMKRGARVRIAWGLGTSKGREGARNRERGEGVLRELRERVPRRLRESLLERRTETHEKFIICDDVFCAWGSFNWLSYRGERDSGYRREASCYSEREEDIVLWKENAKSLFK